MSETTSNLDMIIGQSDDTKFSDYVGGVDENFKKIDAFAGTVLGTSGTVTLVANSWSDKTYSLTVTNLGVNDAIFFSPVTFEDKENLESAGIIITTPQANKVVFTAETAPTAAIQLNYFIARGM